MDELLTARPPRSCLLVGAADAARLDAFVELPGLLTARKRVPIFVDLRSEQAPTSIPSLTRGRFVTELVGSAGDDASGGRVFAHLVGKQRAVALVAGLETVSAGTSKRERQQTLTELLKGCLTERLPFVAALPTELAPSISEIATLRIPAASSAEVSARAALTLCERGVPFDPALEERFRTAFVEVAEPTHELAYLDLALDLVMARVRRGESAADAVDELFADPRSFRRHLGWMCEWALGCRLGEATAATTAVALALRAVGIEAHYRQELSTTWADACRALDVEDQRRFAAGVSILSRRGVLSASNSQGEALLRFTHAGWSAFAGALGLGLDPGRWKDLLTPGTSEVTLDALTAALLLDETCLRSRERSFLRILEYVLDQGEPQVSLDMALAVLAALQLEEDPFTLGKSEMSALEEGWRSSSDEVRLAFVATVDFGRHPLLVDFLWEEVVPPAFQENSYRVRRATCERLASLGILAWDRLASRWIELADAARDRDLSSGSRGVLSDWEEFGLPVASLCWVLPSLVLELEGRQRELAVSLLRQLREIASKGWETSAPRSDASDIGIEISLAEGFKMAAARIAASGRGCAGWWYGEAREFLDLAKSWVSQQALLQGLALADRDDERTRRLAAETDRPGRHPFVRETAALVLRALESGPEADLRQYVWLDDVQALDDGGLELAAEAHRLLGLSTLLINLAEHAFRRSADGCPARQRALTSNELPTCFRDATHTATMLEFPCDCRFHLCGRSASGQVGDRRFSRAFTKRAEATCRAPVRSERRLFTRQAFRGVWQALDRRLESGQLDGARQ